MADKKKNGTIAGIARNVFFLGLVSLFNDFSVEMAQSVMPVFLTSVLGAPAFVVGLIEGVADALSSVLKVFSGWFSDKVGRRKLPTFLGYALAVGTRPFFALVDTFWQVFELRVIDRIGKGFRDAPRDALIAESVERSDLGRSFGFHRSFDTLGATLGPLFALVFLPLLHDNYRHLFLVAFGIGLFALLSFVFVKEKRKEKRRKPERNAKPKLNFALLKRNKKFAYIVFSLFVFGMGTLPILLVLLKAKEAGLPGDEVPLAYLIYNLTFVLTAVPLGKLSDRIGERFVIAMGFLAAAAAYFGMAGTSRLVIVGVLFAVLGLYSAATDGIERALAAKHLAPEILATGEGFLNMAIGFSSLFAGVVGGLLWTNLGSSAALVYAGTFSLIGLALFLIMSKGSLDTAVQI